MSDANAASYVVPDDALDLIPQRPPFLMVDSIVAGLPGQHATSVYKIATDNPVFAGHFPDYPVFPGVLVIENMAQTACWVCASMPGDKSSLYVLVRIGQCTFQSMVRPGDELRTHAQLTRQIDQFAHFECEVTVRDKSVARAEMLVARRPSAGRPHAKGQTPTTSS
jgi:3-hydroxyacyl-[acyl-carrier-protein] dehydratase